MRSKVFPTAHVWPFIPPKGEAQSQAGSGEETSQTHRGQTGPARQRTAYDLILQGIEVNKFLNEVVPRGRDPEGRRFTERLRIIDKGTIAKRTELRENRKYGELEPVR